MTSNKKPELISPAGNMECARAAVANGANAVYFGLPRFNARMRADNFTEKELPEMVEFLHQHHVRAFVTFNTLIFTGELEDAEKQMILLDQAGVDSVIVQDLGLAVLAQKLGTRLAVHASTQMTITSPEGIQFAKKLGIKRVVLARETSMREMAKFTDLLPLEVFVHGALCVAYSGQCLTSEMLGQRSANRGECAQACRLPYDLIVDGAVKDLGDKRYLLSPQDLAAVREIPELIRLGVSAFKIEGRLKTPEYVAATTQVYRKAIDAALKESGASPVTPEDDYTLEMTFSRGLFSGWMHGVNHQKLVHARFGKKRGPFLGFIQKVGTDHVEVKLESVSLAPGDGLVFDTGEDTNKEQGGRVYEIRGNKLFFKHGHIDFSKLKVGDRVWKTSDPKLEKKLQKSFEGEIPSPKEVIHFRLQGNAGQPMTVEAETSHGKIKVQSTIPLQVAQKRPLELKTLQEQFGRLGETRFELGEIRNELQENVMLPVSELNRIRREVAEQMELLVQKKSMTDSYQSPKPVLETLSQKIFSQKKDSSSIPECRVLCRTMDQIHAALENGISMLYVDFEDIRRYSEAVKLVRANASAKILLATPRIQKAGEQGFFKLIENAAPDGILIRNLGALDYFKNSSLIKVGDFSLNVANPLTAELLINERLERLTISYDLNAQQVLDLLKASPPSWFELTIHQHMPMFHMEHCVFAAFLSEGTDHTNCGRPCDHHQVKLRDRVGVAHPLKADVGCRNTVFHAKAQSGADFIQEFIKTGLRNFRVELLDEDKEKTSLILRSYRELLSGETKNPSELLNKLNVVKQLGVTSGTLTCLS